jgi:hypothetical protein
MIEILFLNFLIGVMNILVLKNIRTSFNLRGLKVENRSQAPTKLRSCGLCSLMQKYLTEWKFRSFILSFFLF